MKSKGFLFLGVLSVFPLACGGSGPKYPAPVYEEPTLPDWRAPEPESEDPFADIIAGGEWVEESDDSPASEEGGDGDPSGSDNASAGVESKAEAVQEPGALGGNASGAGATQNEPKLERGNVPEEGENPTQDNPTGPGKPGSGDAP